MARPKPNRRILVTAFNTALATAAVTATAAGWAAFGMADTRGANTAAQADPPAAQSSPLQQQASPAQGQPFAWEGRPRPSGRHHHEGHGFFGSGSDEHSFSQSQPPSFDGSSSQGSSQPLQPITRSRSSR